MALKTIVTWMRTDRAPRTGRPIGKPVPMPKATPVKGKVSDG